MIDETRLQALVRMDVAQRLRSNDLSLTVGNFALALLVAASLHKAAPPVWVASWLGLQFINMAFHLWLGLRWLRSHLTISNAPLWLRRVTRTSGINGLLWLLAVQIFWPGGSDAQRMLLLAWMIGISSAALHSLHAYLPAYFAMVGPVLLGLLLTVLVHGAIDSWAILAVLLLGSTLYIHFAVSLRRLLWDSLRQTHQLAQLTESLRLEKDLAVKLSQSRSRFLAAASHDLRQPVHALSLFVGALKQNPSPAQSAQILQHVSSAVDAMGAMFNALLDISKLDAEQLQPQWQTVDLRVLMSRMAADHSLQAQAKGLRFVCDLPPAGGSQAALTVHSDPALLERVLRNLLSNALRYTTQGGVLLRARRRHGRIELLVADSGVGIARARRAEVFDEFVQLHGSGQGLGLGLAIVQRLSGLLRLGLRLRSRPGRGSVFTLMLEPLDEGPTEAPSSALQAQLQGEMVIVLDESAEIRLALTTLLSAWGLGVVSAASAAELMPQLMRVSTAPRLLLCDYHLAGGESGSGAIVRLRELFNSDIPALLLSGDTGPERIKEALDQGLTLLHKPLSQAQLREAVCDALLPSKASAASSIGLQLAQPLHPG
ncbi:hybrid sensor histidine kinase/response regulator [Paucibacter sp. Y2R2-4]|uniref:ATP-binding response regulator n=1 Tax=Paucibacter sp. Y2R2-4 TaxID=2893553 RepID=UPI0021E507BE|nr:hybrid sensor histidine kinase/response regulator [Paucibacter sp. Y2R2-4]MCV2348292.1 hybrid sensor histidine kinase/response regulator [Paucibacter sp. Y2R2-4]